MPVIDPPVSAVAPSLDLLAEVYQQSKHLYEDDGYYVQEAIDNTGTNFVQAIEALRAAPPIKEPLRLTRGAARRLAMQVADARLKEAGVSRSERRRLMFKGQRVFNFSDLARGLMQLETQPAGNGAVTPALA